MRSFKSAVTRRVNILEDSGGVEFWQRVYHEHVIRKNENINAVREYIINNPKRWSLRLKSKKI